MPRLLKPASRVDVRGVSIQPEVVALRVAIKVETHPVTTHLPAGREEKERAMETCCCPWLSITLLHLPHTHSAWITLGSKKSITGKCPNWEPQTNSKGCPAWNKVIAKPPQASPKKGCSGWCIKCHGGAPCWFQQV